MNCILLKIYMELAQWLSSKEFACSVGAVRDVGLIPVMHTNYLRYPSHEGHILPRTKSITDWQAQWRKSRKQESMYYTLPWIHQTTLQKRETTKSEWWEVILSARKICSVPYSKTSGCEATTLFKDTRQTGRASQTPRPWELTTSAPLSWAGLQSPWACW